MTTQISPKKRHKARNFAVQALYQWQLTGDDVAEITLQFLVEMNPKKCDGDYFRQLMSGVAQNSTTLDEYFTPHLDRALNDVGPVERAILRLAAYELASCLEIPYKVAINEAVELAKIFGPEGSYKYINGVVDKMATALRPIEQK
jgi:N utilization substance protein B